MRAGVLLELSTNTVEVLQGCTFRKLPRHREVLLQTSIKERSPFSVGRGETLVSFALTSAIAVKVGLCISSIVSSPNGVIQVLTSLWELSAINYLP